MADIKALLADPDFKRLSPEAQLLAARQADSDFAGLSEPAQHQVLGLSSPAMTARDAQAKFGIAGPSSDDPVSRFVKGAASYLDPRPALELVADVGMAASPLTRLANPAGSSRLMDKAKAMIAASRAKGSEALSKFGEGDYRGGISSGVEAVPFVGPMASDLGSDVQSGNIAGLAGKLAALIAPGAAQRKLGGVKVENFRNPMEQAAIREASSRGVPVSAVQATGNPTAEALSQLTSKLPIMGSRQQQFINAQKAKLSAVMTDLSATPDVKLINPGDIKDTIAMPAGFVYQPPKTADPLAVGTAMKKAGAARAGEYHAQVDKAADTLRTLAQGNKSDVVTGWQDSYTGVNDFNEPTGLVRVPVTRPVYGAVNFDGVKASIRNAVEVARAELGATAAEKMPALRALEQILDREGPVDLKVALDDLSQINEKARAADPQLRSKSQGLASMATVPIHKAIGDTVQGMGPEAVAAWNTYLESTKKKYYVKALAKRGGFEAGTNDVPGREGDLAMKLGAEPGKVVERYFAPHDQFALTAEHVAKEFPDKIPSMRAAWSKTILDDAIRNGTWDKALDQIAQLGPRTRQLFGIDQQFEQFFRFSRDQAAALSRDAAFKAKGREFLRTGLDGINAGADTARSVWEKFHAIDPASRPLYFGQLEQPIGEMLKSMAQNETTAGLLDQFSAGRTGGRGVQSNIKGMTQTRAESLLGSNAATIQRLGDFASMIERMPNPSGTGAILTLAKGGVMLLKHPLQSTAYIMTAPMISKVLQYGGDGASLLNEAMRLPMGNPNASLISGRILALAGINAQQADEGR